MRAMETERNVMRLEIPEGANVQILIGQTPALALPDETRSRHPAVGVGGLMVKGVLGGVVVVTVATLGLHMMLTGTQAAAGGETPARRADQVPPAFQRQIEQQPTVTPPPGQQPPGKNPFGLEN
jgi:hypothetical protein